MDKSIQAEQLFFEGSDKISQGKFADAKNSLLEAIKADPSFGRAYNHLGWLYAYKYKDYKEAEKNYQLALQFSPDYVPIYPNYAYLLIQLGKHPQLKELVARALTVSGIDVVLMCEYYGQSLELQAQYEGAVEQYEKALKAATIPEDITRLQATLRTCRTRAGISHPEQIETKSVAEPTSAIDLFTLADTEIDQNKIGLAEEHLRKAIAIDPKFGMAYNHLGWIYERKYNKYDESEGYFKKALELSPEYPATYSNYTYLLLCMEEYKKLEDFVHTALLRKESNKGLLYDYYARSLEQQGKFQEAITYYGKAIAYTLDNEKFKQYNDALTRCKAKILALK